MTVQYKKKLKKIITGKGVQSDLEQMKEWEQVMKMNRCGLGHTAANPIMTTIKNFPEIYQSKLQDKDFVSEFDLERAVQESCKTAGRIPNLGGNNE
jgi:[NiFe] hydrogenase diaphorase moiety large subunit